MTELQTTITPRARRPRPKVVTLTEAAAERVRAILERGDKPYVGLRVGVKNGGCAGQEYVLEYAEAANPLDEAVEDKGVTILVDPKAILFLIGTEIDYEVTRLSALAMISRTRSAARSVSVTTLGRGRRWRG